METTDFSTDEEDTMDANGKVKIEALTADAIKASFLEVATKIRESATTAKGVANVLGEDAETLSGELIKAGTEYADRVGHLLEQCRHTSESFREHRDKLAKLPEIEYVINSVSTPASDVGLEAVSKSLE